jgi:hypothetical protein
LVVKILNWKGINNLETWSQSKSRAEQKSSLSYFFINYLRQAWYSPQELLYLNCQRISQPS